MSKLPPRPPKGSRFGGRTKGTPNKTTIAIRDAIQQAYERAGGVDYLLKLALDDPKVFVPLLAKIIPAEPMQQKESGGLHITINQLAIEKPLIERQPDVLPLKSWNG